MSATFAFYRLPYADHYIAIEGSAQELSSCVLLDGLTGFVIAPFELTADQPIVVIHPDLVERRPLQNADAFSVDTLQSSADRSHYAVDFASFHSQIQAGCFAKLVLARRSEEVVTPSVDPVMLFHKACQLYPRMFIALVSTPQSGVWLTATPEILLEGQGHQWRTVALAGTMMLEGEQLKGEGENVVWSAKNIKEQRIVATYIAECLGQFHADFCEEGPRTVRAAHLVHLRSDFTFTLPDDSSIGLLLQALHPTPAVCGIPKREAFNFIVRNEYAPRRYYSGFLGPLRLDGATHLYVSLRCMNIDGSHCYLYAGGGLLADSNEQQEWLETEAKLQTMRRLLVRNS